MKNNEKKLILDLYKHYNVNYVSATDIPDEEINLLYKKYGNIRNILKNLIQEFEPNSEVSEEYLDEKLRIYNISEVEEIKNEEATDEIELEINEAEDKKVSKSKINIFILLTFIFAIVIIGWFQINKKEAKDNINNRNNTIEENQSTNNSENNATNFKVICDEKRVNSTTSEPILIKSCILNNFKSVSTGEADYNGRYSYKYELFIKKNGVFQKSNNEELFNDKRNELLEKINEKIYSDFNELSTNPDTKDCFQNSIIADSRFEDMGIEFNDNKIYFNVWFIGVPEYCFNVSSTTVSFSIEELKPYLNTKY